MVSNDELPEGWRAVDPGQHGLVQDPWAVVGPTGYRGYAPSVVVTAEALAGQTFEAWAQSVIEAALAVYAGSRLLDVAETTAGAHPAQ